MVGVGFVRGFFNDIHHLVHVGKRQNQARNDVRAFLGFVELKAGAAGDDFLLVFDVFAHDLTQVERAGLGALIDERQEIDAVGNLQIGVFIQRV